MNTRLLRWLATVLACLMLASMMPDVGALNAVLAEGEQVAEESVGQETAVAPTDADTALAPSDAVIPVTAIKLNATSKALAVGETFQLTSTLTPENASDPTVTWGSDKETVAKVENGLVTAIGAGKAVVTATASSGVKTQCTFTVKTVQVTKLTVAPAKVTLDLGAKQTLVATVLPANATKIDVTWSTSKKTVAQVDRLTGEVTAVGNGIATITATTTDGSKKTATCKVTVTTLAKGLKLGGPKTVTSGNSIKLTATFDPAKPVNKSLNWASDKIAAATVSSSGVVTAKTVTAATDVTITATTKDGTALSDAYVITVLPKATGVVILKDGAPTTAVTISDMVQLTAQVSPDDASDAVTWSTSNKKTATVDCNGLVTGVSVGTVTITATATDGSKKSAKLKVTVEAATLENVMIRGEKDLTAGGTTTLKAIVLPATVTNKAVTWTSSDDTIATVSAAGVVKAKATATQKTVTIKATAKDGSGLFGELEITVYPKVTAVKILVDGADKATASIDLSQDDKTLTMTTTSLPVDTRQDVSWKSSNTKVAKVTDGVVTGLTAGKTTITATAKDGSGKSDSVVVTVVTLVKSVTISGASEMTSGGTTTLKVSVLPKTAANKAVTWTSSDVTIATVSASGVVKAKATTVQKTVTIKAMAKDGSGAFDAHEITINPKA